MNALDWHGLIRAGLHELRLTPDQFWRLTPVELRIMLGTDRLAVGITRTRLEELSTAFPDTRKADADDGRH